MGAEISKSNSQGIGPKFLYLRDQREPLIHFEVFYNEKSTIQKSYRRL